ncbi:MAG TPA: universal stress protein [Desulfopila sp.]|nr:universal stress protein [Desulfopila sp.]
MKRFENILFIIGSDHSEEERTAERVRTLARQNGARVCIAKVLDENFTEQLSKIVSPRMKQMAQLAKDHLQEEVDTFLQRSDWTGIETATAVLNGRDFIAVISKVLADGHDLVIKSDLNAHGADQLSMRLFRKCPCPVWVIRNRGDGNFKRILAALDLGNDEEDNLRLNRKIIELTHSLARREGGEAHYLHALHLGYEPMMRAPRFNMGDAEIAAIKEEMRQNSCFSLERLFAETAIAAPPENIHLLQGETSTVINTAIKNLKADVLVMGTVARAGVPGLLIGNKAEKILSGITCTVMAVKPDGFESPVKL